MANTTKPRTPKIFVVSDLTSGDARLVRAISAPAAIQHVIAGKFDASVATQDQLVAALSAGVKVEDSSAAPTADEPENETEATTKIEG